MSPTKLDRATRVLLGANSPDRITGILSMLAEAAQDPSGACDPRQATLLQSLINDGFELKGNTFAFVVDKTSVQTPKRNDAVVPIPPPWLKSESPHQAPLPRVALPSTGEERSYALKNLQEILQSFPDVVHNLSERARNRAPLILTDEYDMQYLLGALLKIHFKDVRPEEFSPSVAGRGARLDFLLHPEEIVLELKYVHASATDASLGDELLVDISRYADHPRCKQLAIFIYDPLRKLRNPKGLAADLESRRSAMPVRAIVLPS
jgi:hypothetical protein